MPRNLNNIRIPFETTINAGAKTCMNFLLTLQELAKENWTPAQSEQLQQLVRMTIDRLTDNTTPRIIATTENHGVLKLIDHGVDWEEEKRYAMTVINGDNVDAWGMYSAEELIEIFKAHAKNEPVKEE